MYVALCGLIAVTRVFDRVVYSFYLIELLNTYSWLTPMLCVIMCIVNYSLTLMLKKSHLILFEIV